MTYLAIERSRRSSTDWEWTKFRRVARLRRTKNLRSDRQLLSVSAEYGVRPRPDDGGRQLPTDETVAGYWHVEPDDLVFNPMWAIEGGVAVSDRSGAVSTAYRVYQLSRALHPRFVHYYSRSQVALTQYRLLVRGVTTFDRSVTREDFEAMPLPIPPIDRQRAIADFLDTESTRIDALIAKKRRMLGLVAERFEEQCRRAITQGHLYQDPLGVTMRDALPRGVRPLRLSWLADFGGGTTPESGRSEYYDGTIPWVLTGDLNDGDLASTTRAITPQAMLDYSALKLHLPGSLIVAMYGATIGKLATLTVRATVNQACCVITPRRDVLDSDFLFFTLLGFRKVLVERGKGSGQPNISQETLRSIRLPIPQVADQVKVAAQLALARSTTRTVIARLEKQVGLLQEHRQALITAAITGDLDVPGVAA